MSEREGVCPHCGKNDELYRIPWPEIVQVVIREVEGEVRTSDVILGKTMMLQIERFYCGSCRRRFETPYMMRREEVNAI